MCQPVMLLVTAFDGSGQYLIHRDQVVKIVVPTAEQEEMVDDQPVKKTIVVDGAALVLTNGNVQHVREDMKHFIDLFFPTADPNG